MRAAFPGSAVRLDGPGVAFGVLLTALGIAGCSRSVLPEAMRSFWGVLVVALALSCFAAMAVRARRTGRREGWIWALLPLALALLYLQPQRVASDGIFYYAPLRSVLVDGDLDFENEYRVLGAHPEYFQRTVTGRLPNTWSIGPALLWAPFFLAAHGLAHLGLFRPTGFGYPYFTAVATGTALIGFAGVVFLFRLVRCYFGDGVSLLTAVLVWLSTFHVWYMVFEPSMSHAMAMASVTGFLLLTHRGGQGPRSFAWLGAAGGLVALVRWQNAVYLPVALATSWAAHGRPTVRELLSGGAAFILVFAPQLLYWNALYGSFFLVPQGGGYLDWSQPAFEEVLFSSRHGLFSWAPLLLLGVAGFPGFLRRAPVLGSALAASGLAALYVNASVSDWWAGASFGARRFDGALPALALGLAVGIGWLSRQVVRRPLLATGVLLLPFVVWNAMLMGVYFLRSVPPDGPASFRQAASDGIELVYRRTGYPFSWPAAVWDRILTGRPLAVYDLAGSRILANNVDIRMGETDALYLGRGWSLPRRGRETTSRLVARSGGEIYVALREPAPYTIDLEGPQEAMVRVLWDGRLVGRGSLGAGPLRLEVPAGAVRGGINRIVVLPEGAPPAALSRIRLLRPGDLPREE